jgi:nucleoside-diphosphate-sugar epimerase
VRRPYLTGLDRKPILPLTLRDDPQHVIRQRSLQRERLRRVPWSEWKDRQNELEAEQTYDHIAHSPNCSIAKAERMLGYRPRYRSIEAVCESVSWIDRKGDRSGRT